MATQITDHYETFEAHGNVEEEYDMKYELPFDDSDEIDVDDANNAYSHVEQVLKIKKSATIQEAINKMERDINLAGFERTENETLLENHFTQLFNQLNAKKSEAITALNTYYDEQKKESTARINALQIEYKTQIEKEKDINYMYNGIEPQIQSQPQTHNNIFKRQLTKIKSKMGHDMDIDTDNDEPRTKMHDKCRIFFPVKAFTTLIDEEIRIGSDWWNAVKADHTEFNIHDSKIWRIQSGGWFNAFGSCTVGYTQKKRWNIRILPRENCDLSHPADVVIGVIDADKVDTLFNKNKGKGKKANGFWEKGYEGFGFYGWNGKIFHKQKRGRVYGNAYHVNNRISVELDLGYQLKLSKGMIDNGRKKKKYRAKSNTIKNIKSGAAANGATITFYVDGDNVGVAFYDIDSTKQYVLAVALNSTNYILQLMN